MKIEPIQNIHKLEEYTKKLVKEMHYCLSGKYPLFNSALLLFRPILSHILADFSKEEINIVEYSNLKYWEIIEKLWEQKIIKDKNIYNSIMEKKKISNKINHNYEVLFNDGQALAFEAYNSIRKIIDEHFFNI